MRATRDHTGPRSDSILGQGFQPVQALLMACSRWSASSHKACRPDKGSPYCRAGQRLTQPNDGRL